MVFLLVIVGILLFILIAGGLLSLFSAVFGYDNDPYERELARMDREDKIIDRLDRIEEERYRD